MATNQPNDVGIKPSAREAGDQTPAYQVNSTANDQYSGLSVFANPVEGHTDTGVSHSGDLGGAGKR